MTDGLLTFTGVEDLLLGRDKGSALVSSLFINPGPCQKMTNTRQAKEPLKICRDVWLLAVQRFLMPE